MNKTKILQVFLLCCLFTSHAFSDLAQFRPTLPHPTHCIKNPLPVFDIRYQQLIPIAAFRKSFIRSYQQEKLAFQKILLKPKTYSFQNSSAFVLQVLLKIQFLLSKSSNSFRFQIPKWTFLPNMHKYLPFTHVRNPRSTVSITWILRCHT